MYFYIEYIHIWSANIVLLLFILSAIGHILQDNDKNSPQSKKLIQYYNIILLILWKNEGLHYSSAISSAGSITAIGQALFTKYLLPFEIASLLLLVALIGTVYLAKKRVS